MKTREQKETESGQVLGYAATICFILLMCYLAYIFLS